MFIDDHEWPDMVEDWNRFLTKIKELKPYMVEFNKNGAIKAQDYLVNCAVRREKRYPIIVITHNKYTFFANDGIWKVWTRARDTFLRSKK